MSFSAFNRVPRDETPGCLRYPGLSAPAGDVEVRDGSLAVGMVLGIVLGGLILILVSRLELPRPRDCGRQICPEAALSDVVLSEGCLVR